jgi:hypothetical protein
MFEENLKGLETFQRTFRERAQTMGLEGDRERRYVGLRGIIQDAAKNYHNADKEPVTNLEESEKRKTKFEEDLTGYQNEFGVSSEELAGIPYKDPDFFLTEGTEVVYPKGGRISPGNEAVSLEEFYTGSKPSNVNKTIKKAEAVNKVMFAGEMSTKQTTEWNKLERSFEGVQVIDVRSHEELEGMVDLSLGLTFGPGLLGTLHTDDFITELKDEILSEVKQNPNALVVEVIKESIAEAVTKGQFDGVVLPWEDLMVGLDPQAKDVFENIQPGLTGDLTDSWRDRNKSQVSGPVSMMSAVSATALGQVDGDDGTHELTHENARIFLTNLGHHTSPRAGNIHELKSKILQTQVEDGALNTLVDLAGRFGQKYYLQPGIKEEELKSLYETVSLATEVMGGRNISVALEEGGDPSDLDLKGYLSLHGFDLTRPVEDFVNELGNDETKRMKFRDVLEEFKEQVRKDNIRERDFLEQAQDPAYVHGRIVVDLVGIGIKSSEVSIPGVDPDKMGEVSYQDLFTIQQAMLDEYENPPEQRVYTDPQIEVFLKTFTKAQADTARSHKLHPTTETGTLIGAQVIATLTTGMVHTTSVSVVEIALGSNNQSTRAIELGDPVAIAAQKLAREYITARYNTNRKNLHEASGLGTPEEVELPWINTTGIPAQAGALVLESLPPWDLAPLLLAIYETNEAFPTENKDESVGPRIKQWATNAIKDLNIFSQDIDPTNPDHLQQLANVAQFLLVLDQIVGTPASTKANQEAWEVFGLENGDSLSTMRGFLAVLRVKAPQLLNGNLWAKLTGEPGTDIANEVKNIQEQIEKVTLNAITALQESQARNSGNSTEIPSALRGEMTNLMTLTDETIGWGEIADEFIFGKTLVTAPKVREWLRNNGWDLNSLETIDGARRVALAAVGGDADNALFAAAAENGTLQAYENVLFRRLSSLALSKSIPGFNTERIFTAVVTRMGKGIPIESLPAIMETIINLDGPNMTEHTIVTGGGYQWIDENIARMVKKTGPVSNERAIGMHRGDSATHIALTAVVRDNSLLDSSLHDVVNHVEDPLRQYEKGPGAWFQWWTRLVDRTDPTGLLISAGGPTDYNVRNIKNLKTLLGRVFTPNFLSHLNDTPGLIYTDDTPDDGEDTGLTILEQEARVERRKTGMHRILDTIQERDKFIKEAAWSGTSTISNNDSALYKYMVLKAVADGRPPEYAPEGFNEKRETFDQRAKEILEQYISSSPELGLRAGETPAQQRERLMAHIVENELSVEEFSITREVDGIETTVTKPIWEHFNDFHRKIRNQKNYTRQTYGEQRGVGLLVQKVVRDYEAALNNVSDFRATKNYQNYMTSLTDIAEPTEYFGSQAITPAYKYSDRRSVDEEGNKLDHFEFKIIEPLEGRTIWLTDTEIRARVASERSNNGIYDPTAMDMVAEVLYHLVRVGELESSNVEGSLTLAAFGRVEIPLHNGLTMPIYANHMWFDVVGSPDDPRLPMRARLNIQQSDGSVVKWIAPEGFAVPLRARDLGVGALQDAGLYTGHLTPYGTKANQGAIVDGSLKKPSINFPPQRSPRPPRLDFPREIRRDERGNEITDADYFESINENN